MTDYASYAVRLERCKREDTKELMITCLDKASIDDRQQMMDDFIFALGLVGVVILGFMFAHWLVRRACR